MIDCHVHLFPTTPVDLTWRDGIAPRTVEEVVDYMDEHGIERAVLLPVESPEGTPVPGPSWWVLQQASTYPDRFIPFCVIDPRIAPGMGSEAFEWLIDAYVQMGARGFGEVKCGVPVDHDRLQLIYELCGEKDLPVLLHIDGVCCTDEIGLPNLEEVVAAYPYTTFIVHAQGWWSHISADAATLSGYPDGEVEPGGRCDELLSEYDNLYADLSGRSGYNAITRDEAYGRQFLERHHQRLLWATDYPLYPVSWIEDRHFDLFDRFELGEEAERAIRSGNAARLFPV